MKNKKFTKDRIDFFGNPTIYGIETALSVACDNCKHPICLFWSDGLVHYFAVSWEKRLDFINCHFCKKKHEKKEIKDLVFDKTKRDVWEYKLIEF